MPAQKAHVCYACHRAIPVGKHYRRVRGGVARINVKVPRGVLSEAAPGDPRRWVEIPTPTVE